MKRNNNKKGFTIVELVIVIAVIAILAAVLIPTFSNIIRKANISNDTQIVRSLNTALAAEMEKPNTMHDALKIAEDAGFIVGNINAKASGNEIAYDSKNNVFCYYNADNVDGSKIEYIPNSVKESSKIKNEEDYYYLWVIKSEVSDKFSTYYTGTQPSIITTKGFDAGNTTVSSINYTGDSNPKEVVIRTNGGSLTINDTNNASHQIHYGSAANVTIATGTNCYEGHAIVGAMTITQGHAIADSGAYVGVVKASDGVTLNEVNNGVFVIPTNIEASAIPASVATQIGYTNDGETITANPEKADKSYYAVTSYNDLVNFADKWNSGMFPGAANVKFADNIVIELDESEAWTPIGNWQYPFYGVFDGNGCTISGIKADATHTNYTHNYAVGDSVGYGETYGFFGIVGNGNTTIKNMTVNVSIDIANGKDVGGLIGYVPSSAKFAEDGNKYIQKNRDGSDKTGDKSDWWTADNTAGEYALTLESVVVSGSIKGDSHIAGFVGKYYSIGNIVMNNCINNANVIGAKGYIGGFIGIQSSNLNSITLTNCINTGNIEKTGKDGTECCAAGLIARIVGTSSTAVTLTNCKNTGNITSVYNAYAYAHINTAATPSITGCSNTGVLNHGEGYNSIE